MHSPNSSNSANQRPALQVVPPAALKPNIPPVSPKPVDSPVVTNQTAPASTPEKSHFATNYLWFILTAIIGIGCLIFIPIPHSVGDNAEIIPSPNERESVTVPMSGRVEILVRSNQWVEKDQPVGLVKSEEFNKDIAEATRLNDQFQSEAALSQQQIGLMEANFKEALAKQSASHQKTESLQQQLNQGNLLPQMQELQSQLAGINSEVNEWQGQINMVSQRIIRYQSLVEAGVYPRSKLEEEIEKQITIKRQIEDKKYQVEAKKAQMNGVREKLQQDLRQQQVEEVQSVAAVNSAMQQFKQAVASVKIREQVANQRDKERQRVQNRQKDLIIRAGKAGNVINPDLDKKQNQFLQAGSPLFDIVNPKQPMLEVNAKQEDIHLVKEGQAVTFRPQGMGLLSYQGTVRSIDPVVSSSKDAQQPRTVKVYVSLNKEENLALLQPGGLGVAHIEVESMLLYQMLQREFDKVIPLGKFF